MSLISADSHIVEPADTFEPLGTKGLVPQVREVNGKSWWFLGETQATSFSGIQTGVRFEGQDKLRTSGNVSEVRPGGYLPEAHLSDSELDGVFGSVLYPTAGLTLYSTPGTELFNDVCGCYNDWLSRFCATDNNRLKGMAMLNVDNPEDAAKELARANEIGLAGGLIPVAPGEDLNYMDRRFDVLWDAAERLEMPLAMHIGTERKALEDGPKRHASLGSRLPNADYWVRRSLAEMILSGVFDRNPGLYVLSVEHEMGWVPFFLERLDYHYTQKPKHDHWYVLEKDLPSDYYRSNIRTTIIEDRFVKFVRDLFGVESMMWGSDYPHTESSFPRSREIAREVLAGLTPDEVRAVTQDNVAKLFKIKVDPNFDTKS